MLPVKSTDKQTCLTSLVSVRADCSDPAGTLMYLEDLEGIDIKKLANVANIQAPSGRMFGQSIIQKAARQMYGDIELLIANGNSLKDAFGEVCSACEYSATYLPGGGVKISNVIASRFSVLKIFKIQVLANYTGAAVMVIDDGISPVTFNINLTEGVFDTFNLDYSTNQKIVKVYLQGNSIPLSLINCPIISNCGCGVGRKNDVSPVRYSGLINGNDSAYQYGFKICATTVCSYENLVCNLINQTPNIFALTMLYKCGQIYFLESELSERNNRTVSMDDETKKDMVAYYQGLYNKRMQGTKQDKGLRQIISGYLGRINDKCVQCDNIIKQGAVSG